MSKHHLLCIHGIGKHPEDWVHEKKIEDDKTLVQQFREQFTVMFPDKQFEDYFELHSIAYDPEIEKILDQWQTTLATLTTDLSHIGDLPKSVDWYKQYAKKSKELRESDDPIATHAIDLLFYRFSVTLRTRLVEHVANKLIQKVKEIREANRWDHISVLGHSMGTAMLNDALSIIFNHSLRVRFLNLTEHEIEDTLRGNFKFHSIIQVANCSFTLRHVKARDFYIGAPGPGNSNQDECHFFININHDYDPVGRIAPFNPESTNWVEQDENTRRRIRDIRLDKVTSRYIHSINHYFRDPEVVENVFSTLTYGTTLKPDQQSLKKYRENWEKLTLSGAAKELVDKLKTTDYSSMDSIQALIDAIKEQGKLLQSFRGDFTI